ncbi:hypothetical protein DFJ74DRAFT_764645 [Hyaloraphidium curvatum]|nr:hypothetical protein DFJ74DRAFT_764645 [Hyaloraphidium curvatum]
MADPGNGDALTGAEIIGTDVFLLNGLVELFYGFLSLVPTFFPAPSSGASLTNGAGTAASVVDPVSGDTLIPVPLPSAPAPAAPAPSAAAHHGLIPPFFGNQPAAAPAPQTQPWILRVPARSTDLLALAAACFGGIPSVIFWARGVGRGGGEDQAARDYAVGALIYHISVPLVSLFKFLRAESASHSSHPPAGMVPAAAEAAVAAATQAAQAAAAGRSFGEGAIASGVMHLGLAVGFARWLLRSYPKKPAARRGAEQGEEAGGAGDAAVLRRAGGAALLRATAAAVLAALLTLPTPAATGHSSFTAKEVIDPATGFLVCRLESSSSYGDYQASQCIGWCDNGGPDAKYSRRRLASRSQWGFTCGKYNGTGSCVRAPSLGCKWIRASARIDTLIFNDNPDRYHASCVGPASGTCSLFSDPFCAGPADNGDPVADGGAHCTGRAIPINETHSELKWNETYSFCSEVYDYLKAPKIPESCPYVTQTSSSETWNGPWMAIRSCEDKGNYLRIRRAGFGVMCHGPFPDNSRCSWFTDMGLSILAPGEPAPSSDGGYGARLYGVTCTQTDSGWCKLAADAALRGVPPSYECPGLAPPMTQTHTSTTTTPGPVRTLSPLSDWHCLGNVICGGYVRARRVDADGRNTLQCRGPDAESCYAYEDAGCTIQAASPATCDRSNTPRCGGAAPAPEGGSGGAVCSPTQLLDDRPCLCPCTNVWCARSVRRFSEHPEWDYANGGQLSATLTQTTPHAAPDGAATTTVLQQQATSANQAPPSPTPPSSTWTCIRSCADKGNYVAVRASGRVAQCKGPDAQRCSWYSDRACTVVAPGEPEPSAEGIGMVCPERAEGWCARAVGVFSGEQAADPTCPTGSNAAGGTVASAASPTSSPADTGASGRPSGARRRAVSFALPVFAVAVVVAVV